MSNIEKVQKCFTYMSKKFETKDMNFSKEEYLKYINTCINPQKENSVLEVASGTCACGRSIAPFVRNVTCLDITEAMLNVGKIKAEEENVNNIIFVKGYAENLPFLDNSFDIVISRLAFHHFSDIKVPFKEMVRVLKKGGKFVLIDMEATEEKFRKIEDEIETLRDPSHIKNLSKSEILELYNQNSLKLVKMESTNISVSLENWMNFSGTSKKIKVQIRNKMIDDINSGLKTGFNPYIENEKICFYQRWLMTMGVK